MNNKVKPFVKWVGGKGQFTKKLLPLIPEYKRYIEPFVGGGAMLFFIQPSNFIINDINNELITAYKEVERERERERERETLQSLLKKHEKSHSQAYYLKIRSLDPNELSDPHNLYKSPM